MDPSLTDNHPVLEISAGKEKFVKLVQSPADRPGCSVVRGRAVLVRPPASKIRR